MFKICTDKVWRINKKNYLCIRIRKEFRWFGLKNDDLTL